MVIVGYQHLWTCPGDVTWMNHQPQHGACRWSHGWNLDSMARIQSTRLGAWNDMRKYVYSIYIYIYYLYFNYYRYVMYLLFILFMRYIYIYAMRLYWSTSHRTCNDLAIWKPFILTKNTDVLPWMLKPHIILILRYKWPQLATSHLKTSEHKVPTRNFLISFALLQCYGPKLGWFVMAVKTNMLQALQAHNWKSQICRMFCHLTLDGWFMSVCVHNHCITRSVHNHRFTSLSSWMFSEKDMGWHGMLNMASRQAFWQSEFWTIETSCVGDWCATPNCKWLAYIHPLKTKCFGKESVSHQVGYFMFTITREMHTNMCITHGCNRTSMSLTNIRKQCYHTDHTQPQPILSKSTNPPSN